MQIGTFNFGFKRVTNTNEGSTTKINQKNYKNFLVKAIGFIANQGASRKEFSPPEFNLEEIKIASESDSYIKASFIKYEQLMFKAGYELKGDNDKAIEYLKTRFRIMSFSTGKPIDILWQEVGNDLIKYSNAFLIKSRVDNIMNGIKATGVFNKKPVGGYFRVDPSTMEILRDKNGQILKYKQDTGTDEKSFAPTEVIHIYMDKDANNAFGTPRIIAALEDVKLLRRIEGNIISLIYRFSIPIYQWIIGLPEAGFQATDKEITEAKNEIEKIPMDGVIVTNEKTKIKAIGAEGQALNASPYLKYFEARVFSALNMSESQMGRGGSKQDADSMEAQAHNTVKHFQRILSIFFENFIISELLLEGGFNPITNEKDIVKFQFNEISLETKIKLENHEMLKFQSNINTFEEVRRSLGKKTDTDETRLYFNMIDNSNEIQEIETEEESPAKSTDINGNGQNTKVNKDVESRNRPSNQYGTGSVKIKESTVNRKTFDVTYDKFEMLRNNIVDTSNKKISLDDLIILNKQEIMNQIKLLIKSSSQSGINHALSEIEKINSSLLIPDLNINLYHFEQEASKTLDKLYKDIKKRLQDKRDEDSVKTVFETLEYRLEYMLEYILPKTYWYSFLKTGAKYNIKKAYIQFSSEKDEEGHPDTINPKSFRIEDIPAYHSFCNSKITFKAGEND